MPTVDEAAQAREAARTQGLVVFGSLVLVMGAALAYSVSGIGRILIIAAAVAIDGFFAAVLIRVPRPNSLTPLARRAKAESWPATAAASLFPGLLDRNPHLERRAEMVGTVTLSPSGVQWVPSPQCARAFGATPFSWDLQWVGYARRLRGLGGLAQLTLENPANNQTVTIWMRRAASLHIP